MTRVRLKTQRRTKIIATLGPATDDPVILEAILKAGVNLVRLNFSHGTHASHAKRIDLTRKIAKKLGIVVGILGDLQGPKIRIARFSAGPVQLESGELFTLDSRMEADSGDISAVGIDYKDLPRDVRPGDVLLLDDGRIELCVERVEEMTRVVCRIVVGGILSDHKGINRKGGGLSCDALTEKDHVDMQFAVSQAVDYIAISFPRSGEDMQKARALLDSYRGEAGLIAKIERAEAVENMDAIIEASDGVMVARGDLAVEIGDAEVPLVQKNIIHRARTLDKPVITATQMMESMIKSSIPTRAEVSDVANAVLDNTDAVMLSAETAAGDHPVAVVEAMARACMVAEKGPRSQLSRHRVECYFKRVDEAIAMATMYTANHLDIRAIIALTESGATSLSMSRIRTGIPIYGLSRYKKTLGRMSLYRAVYPVYFDPTQCAIDLVNARAVGALKEKIALQEDDHIILTKGDSMGVGGGSNAMKILRSGDF